jgi:glycosyltransferase involved in cell wall biosynthesis
VLGTLQGDDIFLEMLPEPHRATCLKLISEHCREMQGFIATSQYYADFMAGYLQIAREKIHVVYPGLNLKGHGGATEVANGKPFTIGYFARICPEKGLHHLIEAYCKLRQIPGVPACRLHVSGWLGENNRGYFEEQKARLAQANLLGEFVHVDAPDHDSKVRFLQSLDVLSVPTTYHEPKGLYVLEAWANGIPVVQPGHGSFPELVEATGGGVIVSPEDSMALAEALRQMMERPEEGRRLGKLGQAAVQARFDAATMAKETLRVFQRYTLSEPEALATAST